MRRVSIEVIDHSDQRYETVGDWIIDDDSLTIRVSDLGDWRYNMAVAVHELVEVLLCKNNGVVQVAVDAFDIKFERDRAVGDFSEPGDDRSAPYHNEHCFATAVERMLIAAMRLSWMDYDAAVNAI